MVTFDDSEAASHKVLVEVLTVLGAYIDQLVIIGGWTPELLYPEKGHIGSQDVDLALNADGLPPHVYSNIKTRLLNAKYKLKEGTDNVFQRVVEGTDQVITVKLDLLSGSDDLEDVSPMYIQGMMIPKLRGVGFALSHFVDIDISDELPGGGNNTIRAHVASGVALVCMKAICMTERLVPKDAYDIYFCLLHCPDGPIGLAREFVNLRGVATVERALDALRQKFGHLGDVGPVWAGQVAEAHGRGVMADVQRAAYERVTAMLAEIDRSAQPPHPSVTQPSGEPKQGSASGEQ